MTRSLVMIVTVITLLATKAVRAIDKALQARGLFS